jgi:hypothetical protein
MCNDLFLKTNEKHFRVHIPKVNAIFYLLAYFQNTCIIIDLRNFCYEEKKISVAMDYHLLDF